MDLNSFVNSIDLDTYLSALGFANNYLFRESELTSIDEMFQGENYLAIILLYDTNPSGIGHFVCLRKDDEREYTYMDCLGDPLPESLIVLFSDLEHQVAVTSLSKPLMDRKNNICGKYCIQFCLSGRCHVVDFYESLKYNTKFSADSVINNLLQLKYERIV